MYKRFRSIVFNSVLLPATLKEGMDNLNKRLLQRIIRRIPAQMLRTTLTKWGRLTALQQQSMDFTQTKLTLTDQLLDIFEVSVVFNYTISTKYSLFFVVIFCIGKLKAWFLCQHAYRYRACNANELCRLSAVEQCAVVKYTCI